MRVRVRVSVRVCVCVCVRACVCGRVCAWRASPDGRPQLGRPEHFPFAVARTYSVQAKVVSMVLVFDTFFCDGERIEIVDDSVDFCDLRYIDGKEVNGHARSVIVPAGVMVQFYNQCGNDASPFIHLPTLDNRANPKPVCKVCCLPVSTPPRPSLSLSLSPSLCPPLSSPSSPSPSRIVCAFVLRSCACMHTRARVQQVYVDDILQMQGLKGTGPSRMRIIRGAG